MRVCILAAWYLTSDQGSLRKSEQAVEERLSVSLSAGPEGF